MLLDVDEMRGEEMDRKGSQDRLEKEMKKEC